MAMESSEKCSKSPYHYSAIAIFSLRRIPEPKGQRKQAAAVVDATDEKGFGGLLTFVENCNSVPASPTDKECTGWAEFSSNITVHFDFPVFQKHVDYQ